MFNGASAQDRYWVGGNGQWDDTNHWSTSSGGAGGASLPNSTDNVYFDSNSGLTSTSIITVLPGTYEMQDFEIVDQSLDFTLFFDAPVSGILINMNVYGDFILGPSLITDYDTHFLTNTVFWHLKGTGTINIDTKGKDLNALRSEDLDRDILLLSPLFAGEELLIRTGNLTSNGHDIQTERFIAGGGCSGPTNCPNKTFNLDGSTIICELMNTEFNYGSLALTGTYDLECSDLSAFGESFGVVKLKAYDSNTFSLFIDIEGGTIADLVIETDLEVNFQKNFTVLNNIKINNAQSIRLQSLGTDQTIEVGGDIINANGGSTCSSLLSVEYTGSQNCFISKSSGTFNINNVGLINVKTTGAATFNALESIVYNTESFWSVTPPASTNYYWVGGDGLWSESTNWSLTSGGIPITSGCLPTLVDNVIIDDKSFTADNQGIDIQDDEAVNCNTLFWTASNYSGLELNFPSGNNDAVMNIGNHIYLDPSMSINASQNSEMVLWSSDMELDAPVSTLPRLVLNNSAPVISLLAPLNCYAIKIEQGTLFTNNFDITTNEINVIAGPANSVNLDFGTSTVTINGHLNLQLSTPSQVSYDASEATIICESMDVYDGDFKTLKFINSFSTNGPRRNHNIEKLILAGSSVGLGFFNSTVGESNIDTLILEGPNATLQIRDTDGAYVNHEIRSTDASAEIVGHGTLPGKLIIPSNLCVDDMITFQDLEVIGGSIHAPQGIDNGGNVNISFENYTDEGKLYWVGKSSDWNAPEAWSFSSGACPSAYGTISTYDSLIFDNNSFAIDDNEIFFSGSRTTTSLVFRNTDNAGIVNIPFRLTADNVIVDGGLVTIKDLSSAGNRELHVNEYIHVQNLGQFTLDTVTAKIGLRPDDFALSTLKVESGAEFIGKFSIISIAGHGTGNIDHTVDFAGSSIVDLDDSIFASIEPLSGQSQNNMTWNLLNGTVIDKVQFLNSAGVNQEINLISGFTTNQLTSKHGVIKLLNGASVVVRNQE